MNSQAGNTPFDWMGMLLLAAVMRMGYELSHPARPARLGDAPLLQPMTTGPSPPEEQEAGVLPWQRQASEKAVKRYAEAQEKKWQHWNEAMFER